MSALRVIWPRAEITAVVPSGDLFDDWCVPDRVVSSWDALSGESIDKTFVAWSAETPEDVPGEVFSAQRAFPDYLLRPEREVNMNLAREQGYQGDTPPLYVGMRRPEETPPDAFRRVTIVPGAKPVHRWRNKRWPYYGALVERLVAKHADVQICVVGTTDDVVQDLPDHEQVFDLRGKYTLAETAWVLRNSDAVVGNDCGPAHIADAVLTPTIVLFGPTCELKNGPRYRGLAVSSDAPCSPCQYELEILDSCADPICMTALQPDTVLAAVEKTISSLQ